MHTFFNTILEIIFHRFSRSSTRSIRKFIVPIALFYSSISFGITFPYAGTTQYYSENVGNEGALIACNEVFLTQPGTSNVGCNSYSHQGVWVNMFITYEDQNGNQQRHNWIGQCEQEGISNCKSHWFVWTPQYCPSPYKYNIETGNCEAFCKAKSFWDITKNSCEDPVKPRNCSDQSTHPIDFVDGEKYRSESVTQVGNVFPINLKFYYNNFAGAERTFKGLRPAESQQLIVASTIPPQDSNLFNTQGVALSEEVNPNQYYGDHQRYWRHNYDESLVDLGGNTYSWSRANGQDVKFNSSGHGVSLPHLSLVAMDNSQYGYAGHVLRLADGTIKVFDQDGRLRRVTNPSGIFHELIYDPANNYITRIQHSLGAYIDFTGYTYYKIYGAYLKGQAGRNHLTQVAGSDGNTTNIYWRKLYRGDRTHYGIWRITNSEAGTPNSGREFEYNDNDWPAAITDIYDVGDLNNGARTLYAHFEYDDQGRAIKSELAEGKERVELDYVNDSIRTVTNALGKHSTYEFGDFNGVKRLQRVTGEVSVNCAESNTTFDYWPTGALKSKIKNGIETYYEYHPTRNLQTLKIEAKGTPNQRTTETQWHTEHNKPERIIEADRKTTYCYFDNGQLKTTIVQPIAAADAACP